MEEAEDDGRVCVDDDDAVAADDDDLVGLGRLDDDEAPGGGRNGTG